MVSALSVDLSNLICIIIGAIIGAIIGSIITLFVINFLVDNASKLNLSSKSPKSFYSQARINTGNKLLESWLKKVNANQFLVLLTLISLLAGYCHYNDFSVSVNPMIVNAGQGSVMQVSEVVVDYGLFYHKDIHLRGEPQSQYMDIFLEPTTLSHGGKSVSTLTIAIHPDTPPDKEYSIKVVGTGADGNTHTCELDVKVFANKFTYDKNSGEYRGSYK